jgi:hypothetical protein
MSRTTSRHDGDHADTARTRDTHDPAYQAFMLLRLGFTVAPILFGLDKFFDVLVEWERYLAPEVADLLPGTAAQILYAVGVIEIVAGLVVAFLPRFGGYLVAGWLASIIVNLLLIGEYYDVALRDFALLLAALTLARLATAYTAPLRALHRSHSDASLSSSASGAVPL